MTAQVDRALHQLDQLGYDIDRDLAAGVIAVRGHGIAVAFAEGDAAIMTLLDADAHAERRFQFLHPEAANARRRLAAAGYTITRVDASADAFSVVSPRSAIPTTVTPDALVTLAAAAGISVSL